MVPIIEIVGLGPWYFSVILKLQLLSMIGGLRSIGLSVQPISESDYPVYEWML